MSKTCLIIRLGDKDTENFSVSQGAKIFNVPFFNQRIADDRRIKHEHILEELKEGNLVVSELAVDLLVLAVGIFAADIRISREDSEDSWTREIEIIVPVSNLKLWVELKKSVDLMLAFLTGDRWNIVFRNRPPDMNVIAPQTKGVKKIDSDTLCLFSGGLDSFIGAIDLLTKRQSLVLLAHHKSPDVCTYQRTCYQFLKTHFSQKELKFFDIFLNIPKEGFDSIEKTERGRSFLFLTLGALFASSLCEKSFLIVPENGLISLNVPITPLRLGSFSTKTTHPYFLHQFQNLIDALKLSVQISNPYRFETKGEMLAGCANKTILIQNSQSTMSCAHPTAGRYRGQTHKHCGQCVPCIIRRAAFSKANIEDKTSYYINRLTEMNEQVRAFSYSIYRLKMEPGIGKEMVFKSGPLLNHLSELNQMVEVYERGMNEVRDFFNSCGIH